MPQVGPTQEASSDESGPDETCIGASPTLRCEDATIPPEAVATVRTRSDTPEATEGRMDESVPKPVVLQKRRRGRPRKQPIVIDRRVVDEPRRLRDGKIVGVANETVNPGPCMVDLQLARAILDVFATQITVLDRAMITLMLDGTAPATSPHHSVTPVPAGSNPVTPLPKSRIPGCVELPTQPSIRRAGHATMHRTSSLSQPPPADGHTRHDAQKTLTAQHTVAHTTPESILRAPSYTLPQLLAPTSRSPTPHPPGGGGVSGNRSCNDLSDLLRPIVRVLKRYYRQGASGEAAQPVDGMGPITVSTRALQPDWIP